MNENKIIIFYNPDLHVKYYHLYEHVCYKIITKILRNNKYIVEAETSVTNMRINLYSKYQISNIELQKEITKYFRNKKFIIPIINDELNRITEENKLSLSEEEEFTFIVLEKLTGIKMLEVSEFKESDRINDLYSMLLKIDEEKEKIYIKEKEKNDKFFARSNNLSTIVFNTKKYSAYFNLFLDFIIGKTSDSIIPKLCYEKKIYLGYSFLTQVYSVNYIVAIFDSRLDEKKILQRIYTISKIKFEDYYDYFELYFSYNSLDKSYIDDNSKFDLKKKNFNELYEEYKLFQKTSSVSIKGINL